MLVLRNTILLAYVARDDKNRHHNGKFSTASKLAPFQPLSFVLLVAVASSRL